jgi:hypothetical protein
MSGCVRALSLAWKFDREPAFRTAADDAAMGAMSCHIRDYVSVRCFAGTLNDLR